MSSSSAPDAPDNPSAMQLTLKLATHPVHPAPQTHTLSLPRSSTVGDVKQHLQDDWDGKPKKDGITCVKGGKVCRDTEVLGELFEEELKADPPVEALLHIIVRPNAWTAPFTSPPPDSPLLAPSSLVGAPPLSSPSPSDPTFLAAEHATLPTMPPTPHHSGYSPGYLTIPPPVDGAAAALPTSDIPPLASPSIAAPAAHAPATSGGGSYVTYLGHLQRLVPLQRALLLLNLQRAHHYYQLQIQERAARLQANDEEEADETRELKEVEDLLKECRLWSVVEERTEEVEKELGKRAEDGEARRAEEFQVVHLNGLPYLLYTPGALAFPPRPSASAVTSLARAQAIHHVLTTMLQLLITFQPASPSIAYGRALMRPSGAQATYAHGQRMSPAVNPNNLAVPAGGPLGGAPGPGADAVPGQPQLRRRATLSVVINLDAIISLLVPLFFLSLKLAFLLWIFGRHASPTKRAVLVGMAAAWVVWEGWVIQRRRAQAGRERERGDRERRRVARAQAQAVANQMQAQRQAQAPGGAQPGQPPVPGAAARPAAPGQPGPAAPPRRRSPTARREPPSRFSPRYWLNAIAAVGLVSEARELGLSPRYIAGRPIPPAATAPAFLARATPAQRARYERIQRLRRAARNIWVALVLFVGTLSPEVERKRKKALEKRERLLAEKRIKAAQEALRASGAVGPPASRAPPTAHAGASTSANAEASTSASTAVAPASTAAADGLRRREGRQAVSDEELFRDGPGEANEPAPGPSAATSTPAGSPSLAVVDPAPERTGLAAGPPVAQVPPPLAEVEDEDIASASGSGGTGTDGEGDGEVEGDGDRPDEAEAEAEFDQVVALF
ncbi:hypothetical protein JCM1841_001185 [Sporobolomyces salmonicolor]